jgi:hypothetical protein
MHDSLRKMLFRPFVHLPTEVLWLILYPLLVREKPINIGIRHVEPPFPEASSLTRVSKRFHEVSEYMIYHLNTFEIWSSDIWFWHFLTGLSSFGVRALTRVRLQWLDPPFIASREILDLLASCTGLIELEIFCFRRGVPEATLRNLAALPVKSIWFETESCVVPNLTLLPSVGALGPRTYKVGFHLFVVR